MFSTALFRKAMWVGLLSVPMLAASGFVSESRAATAQEIDASVDAAMARFDKEVQGADEFLKAAKGILIFPGVVKAGFGIGGEYGEGALRIRGKTVDYYNIASASVGFQIGAEKKDIILLFMQDKALQDFRASSGWKAGVDGSVTMVNVGAGGSLDTETMKDPIVGFIIGQKGLMANLSLEGTKISKLDR
jgi:lipid-binding SYLF domain-containing protein